MRRVESEPDMTALFADHRVAVSTLAPSSRSTLSASPSILPATFVSILRPGAITLLSGLVLMSLVLTSPAGR
jgi:hypothetical protein